MLSIGDTVLRASAAADIPDYRRWFTEVNEWMNWDAPWEPWSNADTESFLRALERDIGGNPKMHRRLEIDTAAGEHIGWVSAYNIDAARLAVGIDIPPLHMRGLGHGTRALEMYVGYLFKNSGHTALYTQTWSGNIKMLALARKLGFAIVKREFNCRTVNSQTYDELTLVLCDNTIHSKKPPRGGGVNA